MKTYVLFSFLFFSIFAGYAQTVQPDTLLLIDSPSRLVITESKEGSEINVTGLYEEDGIDETVFTEYPSDANVSSNQNVVSRLLNGYGISNSKYGWWDVITDGVCFGLTRADGQGYGDGLQWGKSIEISWLSIIGVKYSFRNFAFSLGLGVDWRNYKITTSDRYLVANSDKGIEWAEYPKDVRGRFSRLKVFSLQLPLFYRWNVPKSSLKFRMGPVFCFNTYGSLKTVFDDSEGNRRELFTKDIKPRRFTVDFMAALSFNHAIGVYVRYSPMKVIDACNSINFRPLTLGVTLGI